VRAARTSFTGLSRAERVVLILGCLAVVASFAIRVATLAQPLVEAHAFRQTQTAYTALIYHRQGIDLLQTPLPVLGPPWVIPFEFPLYQALAALVMDVGVPTEIALRSTSLVFFAASMILVWAIVRLEVGRRTAAVAAAAFALAPLGLLWSRTSMIETIAVATALAAVFEALRWDRTGSRLDFVLAIALGALAALLKITTAAIWLAPAIFLLRRSRVAALALVAIPAVAGFAWTAYTDGIKAASPATAFMTSTGLRDWNFGSLAQRLDPATWWTCLGWLAGLGLVVCLAPLVVRRSRIGTWAMATLILGPLVFTNLYVVHDYYWMAVAPAAAILIGLVVRLAARPDRPWLGETRQLALLVLFAASFVTYERWTLMFGAHDEVGVLPQAAQIRAMTDPDDLVRISQGSWSPAVLFYADRRGYMDDPHIPPGPPEYVHIVCPYPGNPGDCVRD